MKKERGSKIFIGIIVGAILGMVTLITLGIILLLFVFTDGPPDVITGVENYEEALTKYEDMKTGMIVFPEAIPEGASDADFYFSYQFIWDDPDMEVFLQCTYDEETYRKEIMRLENTQKQYGSVVRGLTRDEEGVYPYPAYIAVDGHSYCYEYALLSGERQITYIYSSLNYKDDLKKIEEKYLPDYFDSKQETLEFGEGYSIYIENKSETEISYDYTRDSVVKVWKHHPVTIGYNWFSVDTCLDEQDREIIQTCSYMYYENEEDAIYGLPKEIIYTELEGCEYRSVNLNAENTKAIVTYFDGKEEKRMEYEIPKME